MYYIVSGFLYLLSLLPWRVLYFLSDGVYGIMYYLVGYRKQVVLNNLAIAFPEKTDVERLRIAKDFYHNFLDTFIETIKLMSASEASIRSRISVNAEVLNDLYDTGKNVQILSAHFFNWEFGNLAMSLISRYPFIVVYMPVKSQVSDKLILNLRRRFGGIMVPATSFRRSFRPYAKDRYALTLVADQNPGSPTHAYWMPFFGKMVPFLKGPEKGAKSSNDAIIFAHFFREKRGHYKVEFKLLTTEPRLYAEGALTKELIRLTEEAIRKKPSNYLWSHRRWKWEYKEEYKDLVIE
jgi:KDO2-lipid IV(A) lauroyltransferase